MLGTVGMMGQLTINGRPLPEPGVQDVNRQAANIRNPEVNQEAKTAETPAAPENKANISERFAEKMLERCQREMEKRPPTARNMENAKILADSLVTTAKEIEKHYGKEQANGFMSQMLAATDQKVDERMLASAVKTFFETVKVEGLNAQQRKGFSGILNRGCASLLGLEDDGAPIGDTEEPDTPEGMPGDCGLAHGMNLFFGTVTETEIKNFDLDYNWVTLSSEPIDLTKASQVTASEFSKSEEAEGLADFLLNRIGSEEAAAYIRNLPSGSNFMEAVASSLAIVIEDKGYRAGEEFVAYLNQNVKAPIDDSLSEVTFFGWRLGGDPGNPLAEPLEPRTEFWFMDGSVDDKGHTGLMTKFKDNETGVGIYKTQDLDELYAAYTKSRRAEEEEGGARDMAQPVGNLVDAVA